MKTLELNEIETEALLKYIEFYKNNVKNPGDHNFEDLELYWKDINEALMMDSSSVEMSSFCSKSGNPECFDITELFRYNCDNFLEEE